MMVAQGICDEIADGKSLASICSEENRKRDKTLPTRTHFLTWCLKYQEIADIYKRARDMGVEVWGDELSSIAKGVLFGKIDPNAARVSADITKWVMARLSPRKWSEKAMEAAVVTRSRQNDEEDRRRYAGLPASLVASHFADFFRDVASHKFTHYWEPGGRGAGRSTSISLALVDLLMTRPNIHALVCRQVKGTIRDSVLAQMIWAIDELGLEGEFTVNRSNFLITRNGTGQHIYFRGLDDPMKIKSIKPPFGYIGAFWLEEADQAKGEEALRSVRQSYMRGGEEFWNFESWNTPRNLNHWINQRQLDAHERSDIRLHHSTYLALPPEWLGRPFLEEAEALKAKNEDAYRHEYLGEAVGFGGQVFENLSIEQISQESIQAFDNIFMGIDWGFASDPFAWVKMHYDKRRKVLYVFEELVATGLSDENAASILKARGVNKADRIICDSAEPKSISSFRTLGFMTYGSKKYKGSLEYGVKWLQNLELIVIDPARCPVAAREFMDYSYKEDGNGGFLPVIIQKNDHCVSAVRYGMDDEINQAEPTVAYSSYASSL